MIAVQSSAAALFILDVEAGRICICKCSIVIVGLVQRKRRAASTIQRGRDWTLDAAFHLRGMNPRVTVGAVVIPREGGGSMLRLALTLAMAGHDGEMDSRLRGSDITLRPASL